MRLLELRERGGTQLGPERINTVAEHAEEGVAYDAAHFHELEQVRMCPCGVFVRTPHILDPRFPAAAVEDTQHG
eukprot:3794009-Prymnesium_polylepis.1